MTTREELVSDSASHQFEPDNESQTRFIEAVNEGINSMFRGEGKLVAQAFADICQKLDQKDF